MWGEIFWISPHVCDVERPRTDHGGERDEAQVVREECCLVYMSALKCSASKTSLCKKTKN